MLLAIVSILFALQYVIQLQNIAAKRALVFGFACIGLSEARKLCSRSILAAVPRPDTLAVARIQRCAQGKQISGPMIQVFRNQIAWIEVLIILGGR